MDAVPNSFIDYDSVADLYDLYATADYDVPFFASEVTGRFNQEVSAEETGRAGFVRAGRPGEVPGCADSHVPPVKAGRESSR
jgi:hypothetical protein